MEKSKKETQHNAYVEGVDPIQISDSSSSLGTCYVFKSNYMPEDSFGNVTFSSGCCIPGSITWSSLPTGFK